LSFSVDFLSCNSNPIIKITHFQAPPRKTVGGLWWKYVGLPGKVIAIDRFGISAPGNSVMKELGMTKGNVIAAAKKRGGDLWPPCLNQQTSTKKSFAW
jgi:hypothetical protein